MTRADLHRRARAAGIDVHWRDAQGTPMTLRDDTIMALLEVLSVDESAPAAGLEIVRAGSPLAAADHTDAWHEEATGKPCPLRSSTGGRVLAPSRPGYYVQHRKGDSDHTIAVVPDRCFNANDWLGEGDAHRWGVAAQVYGLRREGDGRLGDSAAVAQLGERVSDAGGDAVALSPLHATAPADRDFSPYSPSHRAWLDTLQCAPAQIVGESAFHDALDHSGQTEAWWRAERRLLVEWPEQDAMRHAAWRSLAERWGRTEAAQRALDAFCVAGGASLQRHALFAARQRVAVEHGEGSDWRRWNAAWHDMRHPDVAAFAQRHAQDIRLECFKQWVAAECWKTTQQQLRNQGQRTGLIWDLATGFVPGGSEAWQQRALVMDGVHIGAPPDAFNLDGQDWGLAAYSPAALQRHGYAPIRELLARMMSRGGGLRIDHILGWSRLWLIPRGGSAKDGGYVRYPLRDLLSLLALESWRHRCLVIGEDLGTVPPGLRRTLAEHGVMGIDVLQFTRDPRGRFLDPSRWRADAVAMSSTHDLPPLNGWRAGSDIDASANVHGWSEDARAVARARRLSDVAQLDRMLERFSARTPRQAALEAVAESPAPLALFPLEDLIGEQRQPNLPGTTSSQHPNWRRRLSWRRPSLLSAMRLIDRHRKVHAHA